MEMKSVLFLVVFLGLRSCSRAKESEDAVKDLIKNNVLQGAADIVFLLDRSGSVGYAQFETMKGFVESLLMQVVMDVNATRVAVITYSTTVKLHINYIRNPKSKCFFAQEMLDVKYEEVGATDIGSALEEARLVLRDARTNVKRVVILVSDGIANLGPDPVPIAKRIQEESGAEIFTFGIGKFLRTQLRAIATSPEHSYACPGFREFSKLAKLIRGDPHESRWSSQISATPSCDHLCNSPYRGEPNDPGCCDHHAECSCALLSGTHTCVCQPGYFGLSGTWGKCRACPRGSYKSHLEPSISCTECPLHSTTSNIASTSVKDCRCKEGYIGNPSEGIPCESIRCPPLQNPTNGFIVNLCKDYFSSTCYFMCDDGYELVDQNAGALTCKSDGQWSYSLPVCQKIRCSHPTLEYGYARCDQRDLFAGTSCNFTCMTGFLLKGSRSRKCLSNKQWSGLDTSCVAITCPIPKPLQHGTVMNCKQTEKPVYGVTCFFRCIGGFELKGPEAVTCNEHGDLVDIYTNAKYSDILPYCEDVQAPEIVCPEPVAVEALPGSAFALLQLKNPYASDNSGIVREITSNPPHIQSPAKFPIGRRSIVYKAVDDAGLNAECTFIVDVYDKEPPNVINCPADITVNTSDIKTMVFSEEPVFHDNSGSLRGVKSNLRPGSYFNIGKHLVNYYAVDFSGNSAVCQFNVIVAETDCKYFPPPINGALACEDWMFGQHCQAYCQDKYDFNHEPAYWYICNDEAQWETVPENYPMPWPDCMRKKMPRGARQRLHGYYYSGNCNDFRVQTAIKRLFLYHFKKQFPEEKYCKTKNACMLEMVKVKCGTSSPVEDQPSHARFKRDAVSHATKQVFDIEFDIIIDSSNDSISEHALDDFFTSFENFSWDIDEDLHHDLAELDDKLDQINEVLDNVGGSLLVTSREVQILCSQGAVLKDHVCMLCPPGSFHNLKADICEDCPIGHYQEKEGQVSCLPCPGNMTTIGTNGKNKTECKDICMKGTYSSTGLETCIACPIGMFQDKDGQKSCIHCPNGTTTPTEASSSVHDCQTSCYPGTYSILGFEPCQPCDIGFYQDDTGQMVCKECPVNFTTMYRGSTSAGDCLDYDHCVNGSVCEHGSCITVRHDVFCQCQEGYEGKFCQQDVDECLSDPCLNGGSCVNLNGSFYCICSVEFEGKVCETETDDCKSEPCMNGGTCVDQYGDYLCICTEMYGGKNCEKNFLCSDNTLCVNGGYCSDVGHCICPRGFTGLDCSVNVKTCEPFTCQNFGSCIDGIDEFHCICAAGYSGLFCETEINECDHHECQNGASCLDFIGRYACLCPHEWSGEFCDIKLASDFVLSYPEEPSLSNMALSSLDHPLEEGTLSVWVQTRDTDDRSSTLVSYAAYAKTDTESTSVNASFVIDNALTLMDCSDLTIYINNKPINLGVNVSDGMWHHLSFTWTSNNSGIWEFYKDGQLVSSGEGLQQASNIPSGGVVVVGQEQDKVGGGFSMIESFSGNITRLNIWNSYFPSGTIKSLCNLKDDVPGKVVAWADFRGTVSGDVQLFDNMIPEQ